MASLVAAQASRVTGLTRHRPYVRGLRPHASQALRARAQALRVWAQQLQRVGSAAAAHSPRGRGLSNCDAWAPLPHGMRDLPRQGIEAMPPALADTVLTTRPSGKSL